MSQSGKEMVKRAEALFKKYRPYTLKFANGSSITMDNLDSMIKLCKERGLPFDPASYPARRGEKAKDDATQQEEETTGTGQTGDGTAETAVDSYIENVDSNETPEPVKKSSKKTATPRGSKPKSIRGKRQSTKGD